MVAKNLASQVNADLEAADQVLSRSFRGVSDKEIVGWVLKSKLEGQAHTTTIPHARMVGPFNVASSVSILLATSLPTKPSANFIQNNEGYKELEQRVAAAGGKISPSSSYTYETHLKIDAN